ncbi:hypothetical protein BZA77DRAFT_307750 [Pyronema omphalodes]|nr:hypothetical protein BZA77DRAFT_307750 [Pyronema omphalodes]
MVAGFNIHWKLGHMSFVLVLSFFLSLGDVGIHSFFIPSVDCKLKNPYHQRSTNALRQSSLSNFDRRSHCTLVSRRHVVAKPENASA